MDVKAKVNQLIKRCGTDNPVAIAKELGIKVMYAPLGGRKYGNYIKYKRVKTIIIDRDILPPHLFRFVFAHELGHAVCTPNENTQWLDQNTLGVNSSRVEYIANHFATELLLNDRYLQDHATSSIYALANQQGVPESFVGFKAIKKSARV